MEKIRKKSREEIENDGVSFREVKVGDMDSYSNFFYWACDTCKLAFFKEDSVLETLKHNKHEYTCCPKCKKQMYGGDEDCFNKYYAII